VDLSASFEGKMTWESSGSGGAGQVKVRSKINDKHKLRLGVPILGSFVTCGSDSDKLGIPH
jgi:hypothetical protein